MNNDHIYDIAYSHAISAETQTHSNGITGKIELRAFDKVRLDDIQVFPEVSAKEGKDDKFVTILGGPMRNNAFRCDSMRSRR